MVSVGSYRSAHFEGVKALWEGVFPNDPPWNRAEVAIPEKFAVQPDLFLVAEEGGEVIGTAMAGYDGQRGWLYTIAVKQDRQRSGVGSKLLSEAENRLKEIGCGKINLQIRAGNEAVIAFYRRHGYEIEDRVSMGKRTAMPDLWRDDS